MDYELEFHPVGDASKAGDAISVRYGVNGHHQVIVIDGGTTESGEALVQHITDYYGPKTVIAHAISSHPDTDHASGLREILKAFPVQNLWIHGLWHHTRDMLPYYADKRLTEQVLADKLRKEYPIVEELIDLANQNGTTIYEPFEGAAIGPFTVLSPTLHAYTRLVPQFRKGPDPDVAALENEGWRLGEKRKAGLLGTLIEKAISWVDESWNIELLREGAATASENETSTVLLGQFGTDSVLLTADAGVWALSWACERAERLGINLSTITLIQVPHHGSRSNVTPSILNRLLGPKLGMNSPATRMAVVSSPKDDEKHPRKMVVNAFRRRGAAVFKTQGAYFRRHSGTMPVRPSEIAAVPFDWFGRVESYD